MEDRLSHEPDVETHTRKPLVRPVSFDADWELRFGPKNRFRVFYTIDHNANEVHILAVGVKLRDRLTIDGKEVEL